jgi:arylformamidase
VTRDLFISMIKSFFFFHLESEKARFNHECQLNIPYGDSFRQKLDIFGCGLKLDSPIFVYIHGGYWQGMEKWNSAYVVDPLVKKGIRVIVLDYDLCPSVTLEQLVAQVQKAFKWISDYVNKHSIKTVSLAGHSAGAHLLAMALTQDFISLISKGVEFFTYFISGVYDLQELRFLKASNENNVLFLNDDNVRKLSPQFHNFAHLKDYNMKHFVFAGEFESEKFKQQSRDFAEGPLSTLNHSDSVKFKIISERDHFDMVEKKSEDDYEVTKLIISNSLTAIGE